jgi:hypothetical protein
MRYKFNVGQLAVCSEIMEENAGRVVRIIDRTQLHEWRCYKIKFIDTGSGDWWWHENNLVRYVGNDQ